MYIHASLIEITFLCEFPQKKICELVASLTKMIKWTSDNYKSIGLKQNAKSIKSTRIWMSLTKVLIDKIYCMIIEL